MKRILLTVALAALACGSLAAAAVLPTVKTADVGTLGTVVVSAKGHTLYHYTVEAKNQAKCKGACAKQWPPLLVKAGTKPVAGPGVAAAKLGVVKRADGTYQVTYGGLALYLFAGDAKAGDANGESLAGKWFAVSPAAKIVKDTTPAPSAGGGGLGSSGYGTSGSGSSTGGDYGGGDY